ncbi:hypothetical protein [Allorhizocola rhizosphaerae]|uniref:hypothetical protein n=1 Tax=Allorhizocola rhizosphaerae TaxID=1872709 RepID=UPI000E3D49FB|nr:hypothetical protein [Allorhizocola rhizosphaerae]
MRHIWSLILGVLFAPLAWFLIAFGQSATSRGQSLSDFKNDFILGGLLIVGVGLLLGLIGSLRTSPLGALIASLVFLGASGFMIFAPRYALDVFGDARKIGAYDINLATPLTTGVLGVVGGMLLLSAFSPARWRAKPAPAAPAFDSTPATSESVEWKPQPEAWASLPAAPASTADSGTDKSS